MFKPVAVAIDGPAGAGKSTVSRLLASATGFQLLDTGAMYRAYTWALLNKHPNWLPTQAPNLLASHLFSVSAGIGGTTVTCDGADISNAIRSTEVANEVSAVAAIAQIRELAVAWQRKFVEASLTNGTGVILEGRDIGTVVLPRAEFKFFITADTEVRARRRASDDGTSPQETLASLISRDDLDSTRAVSPLRPADDAIIIDTTHLTAAEVVDSLLAYLGGT